MLIVIRSLGGKDYDYHVTCTVTVIPYVDSFFASLLFKPLVGFAFYHHYSESRRCPRPPTQFVRGKTVSKGDMPNLKKAKTKASFERDIVFLPFDYPEEPGVLPFPQGKV